MLSQPMLPLFILADTPSAMTSYPKLYCKTHCRDPEVSYGHDSPPISCCGHPQSMNVFTRHIWNSIGSRSNRRLHVARCASVMLTEDVSQKGRLKKSESRRSTSCGFLDVIRSIFMIVSCRSDKVLEWINLRRPHCPRQRQSTCSQHPGSAWMHR